MAIRVVPIQTGWARMKAAQRWGREGRSGFGRKLDIIDLDGPPVGPFPSSRPITKDGRVFLVPTPGHFPGHVAVVARRASPTSSPATRRTPRTTWRPTAWTA
jgi:hypothetical protein